MAMTELNTIDFAAIDFPSDQLNIGVLRRQHHDLFDQGYHRGDQAQPAFFFHSEHNGHAKDVVWGMLYCERTVAAAAYAQAAGIEPPDANVNEFKETLADYYETYHLSSGPQQSQQMIRRIETQAAKLAAGPAR